ncbi:phosphoheptose isomerase [Aurantivibrio infirmus]
MQQRIIDTIHQSIETKMQAGEVLTPLIADASQLMVNRLLEGKKILVAGNGTSAALGQVFVSNLMNRLSHERPSLPALNIAADGACLTAISADTTFNDVFAKQIRALGQAGDLLLLLSSDGNGNNLVQAVSAAHDREMTVIALTSTQVGEFSRLLDINDMELRVPSPSNIHTHEVHLLTIFCLCDLIDFQLFGAQETL